MTNRRILIVDDNPSIHDDFEKILSIKMKDDELASMEELLFDGDEEADVEEEEPIVDYQIDHAFQGMEAIEMVRKAAKDNDPYALIYMDVRMPPGIDGIKTISKIWEEFPYIEMVICTAYSDYSWDQILTKFGQTDKLFFIKKPVDVVTVKQLSLSLSTKYDLAQRNRDYMVYLEDEVKSRTEQLRKLVKHMTNLKNQAEEANRLKSAFISNISHEIRTPLNIMMGFASLLKSEDNIETKKKEKYIDYINNCGDTLLGIIEDLISIAKLEAGQIKISPGPLMVKELLDELHDVYQFRKKDRIDLRLTIKSGHEDTKVQTDVIRLKQILTNLLDNALKFTNDGEVEFGFDLQGEDVVFFVRDTGIGIPKDKLEYVFERFGQIEDATVSAHNGVGIGTSIARKLTELLGGTMWVESEYGQGSTFFFKIPYLVADNFALNQVPAETDKKVEPVAAPIYKWGDKKVLIIEAEELNYLFLKEAFYPTEIRDMWVLTGGMALECIRIDSSINLVLMDLRLDDMNATELAEEIWKIRPELPIIAQTLFPVKEEEEKCLELGFKGYISKPIAMSNLLSTVDKVFESISSGSDKKEQAF